MEDKSKNIMMGVAIGSISAAAIGAIAYKIGLKKAGVAVDIAQNTVGLGDIHKILVCGSGMMVPGLVKYLVRDQKNHLTIASNIIEDANTIANSYAGRCTSCLLDANDLDATVDLVREHDIVISFIPPFLHTKIFDACLKAKVNLVTASYIAPEMEKYDQAVKDAGLIFLNECGLDPGIDIMSTMKIKDEVEKAGGKITRYESWCGGLPAAEDADNPLCYKFSWNPKAVFNTSRTSAVFLKDGEVVNISPEDLLTEGTERKDYMKSLHLEGYPNRDSLKFKESFGFKDAKTFIRGTLRYGGFGVIMRALHQIGYTDSNIALDHSKIKTIRDFAEYLAEGFEPKVEGLEDVFEKANINKVEDQKLFSRLIQKLIQKDDLASILSSWVFFELLNSKREITEDMKTALDVMSVISLEKMSYKDGERDFVAMKHIFDIEEASGEKKTIHSTMMVCGDKTGSGGMSIMAKTVGYTSAIAVNLILEGKITRKGVISPKTEDIYSKILPILEEDGITVVEEYK